MASNEFEMTDNVEAQVVGAPAGMRLRPRGAGGDDEAHHSDEDGIVQQKLTAEELKWAFYVCLASGADLFGSGVILSTAFKYAYRDNGVSLYTLGIQAVSHWISSLILLVRFTGELRSQKEASLTLLRGRRLSQLYREQFLSICMALVMLISSCALLFKAFRKIRFWKIWYSDMQLRQMDEEVQNITAWLAWTGFAIYIVQAIFRALARCKVNVSTLTHGFVASCVSLVYLMVLGIAAKNEREWSWKAEPIAAIVLVLVTLAEAVRIIYSYIDDMEARLSDDPRA
eukprot:TRINITY_DN40192_c0_g1_i1.p1 TRINITY_DN40192_c0_g1~~TRINITY_DN40192_c0_g1_i1.p1  ORF type:complete len:285 (-),score=36.58 TRINITY_DN40192_c0_g1_i1:32-886(-)